MAKITKARGATSTADGSHLLARGSATPAESRVSEPEAQPADELTRPAVKDPKDAWVAYAEAVGVATVDADGKTLTKPKLIEAVDAS